jgi:AcrR family transcriptional regulator
MSEQLTKRQQRAAATAEQLLAAAREVFESRGYVATTVGAITTAANTAHGTFYLYFRNKEDAFGRVMASVTEEMYREARAPWAGDPFEALEIATRGYLNVFQGHRGLWRCLIEGMHRSPAVGELWLQLRRPFVERIARNLERLVETGAVRAMNTAVAAHALGSMVEWFAFAHFVLGEPSEKDHSLDDVAHTLADLWFHAVYGRAEHPVVPG